MLSANSLAEIKPPVKVRVGVRRTDCREGKEALGKASGICPDVTGLIGKALGEGSASRKLGKTTTKTRRFGNGRILQAAPARASPCLCLQTLDIKQRRSSFYRTDETRNSLSNCFT